MKNTKKLGEKKRQEVERLPPPPTPISYDSIFFFNPLQIGNYIYIIIFCFVSLHVSCFIYSFVDISPTASSTADFIRSSRKISQVASAAGFYLNPRRNKSREKGQHFYGNDRFYFPIRSDSLEIPKAGRLYKSFL